MKEVVFSKKKSIILMLPQIQNFLHGKDNTFSESNPTITERFNQNSD